jgi:RimJ/RimL family protein N-acetyltransferase
MFFRSERLFLRPGWPEDWDELTARIADPAIVRNLATAPWPYTACDARNFLAPDGDPRCPQFVVTLPTSAGSELVGCTGFARGDAGVELGYWIARPYWGQGYATEAARAALSLARTLGHRRVVASHFEDNPGSGRVLAKLGFRPSGGKVLRFSLARGEAAPARTYAVELAAPCSDDDPGDDMSKRAA